MDDRTLSYHGLAIKRLADAQTVASLTGQSVELVAAQLAKAVATGRAVEAKGGFTLTPLARVALQSSYDRHFGNLRRNDGFIRAYEGFERINNDLKQIITDWQTITLHGERRANDHTDLAYDERILDRLSAHHERAEPIFAALSRGLPRLSIYGNKLESALDKAESGQSAWVSDIHRESYHTVWFELHEELLRIMGRERAE